LFGPANTGPNGFYGRWPKVGAVPTPDGTATGNGATRLLQLIAEVGNPVRDNAGEVYARTLAYPISIGGELPPTPGA
jgi:hypothetical protein